MNSSDCVVNPFAPGGELSKEADELVQHCRFVQGKFHLSPLDNGNHVTNKDDEVHQSLLRDPIVEMKASPSLLTRECAKHDQNNYDDSDKEEADSEQDFQALPQEPEPIRTDLDFSDHSEPIVVSQSTEGMCEETSVMEDVIVNHLETTTSVDVELPVSHSVETTEEEEEPTSSSAAVTESNSLKATSVVQTSNPEPTELTEDEESDTEDTVETITSGTVVVALADESTLPICEVAVPEVVISSEPVVVVGDVKKPPKKKRRCSLL